MFEMLWIKSIECFDVIDIVNDVQYRGVVDNNHVLSRNVKFVEVDRSCLVKYVKM